MNLFTADLHFGHQNVIKHDGRPWSNVDDMDRDLIKLWNSRVTDNDDVYIDGDMFLNNKLDPVSYLRQLKGKKHLIIGNHDKKLLENSEAMQYFVEVDKIITVKDNGRVIVISHTPMVEWDGYFKGWYHVYAHIHNNTGRAFQFLRNEERALNAGCMINGYMPVTFDELITNNKLFKESNNV